MRHLLLGLSLAWLGCEAAPPLPSLDPVQTAPAPHDTPAPAGVEVPSQEPLRYVVTKSQANIRTYRDGKAPLLGQTMSSTRLPVYEEVKEENSGCSGTWLRVQYDGWICDNAVFDAPKPGPEVEDHLENRLPMQPATIANSTKVYDLPGGKEIGTRAKGGQVEVWRITTFEGVAYAQVGAASFIPADDLKFKGRGAHNTKLKGEVFTAATVFPYAFFVAEEVSLLDAPESKRVIGKKLRYERGSVLAKRELEGKTYLQLAEGWIEQDKGTVVIEKEPRPEGVPAGTRWGLVDLTGQYVVAYDGDQPVYATLISSGRAGAKGAFWTVTGSFRLTRKYRNKTMEGSPFGEPYIVHDVPWPQYVFEGYAFHGAFWHNQFGNIKSHGCMNLAPIDSKWLADFFYPQLPPGWVNLFPPLDMDTSIINIRL